MQTREKYLLALLAATAGLYWWSRTRSGSASVEFAATETLDFVDVTATRIKNAIISRGYRDNNPGNIRYLTRNAWNGQIGNDGGYGIYDSPQSGTRALGKQLEAYKLYTVREIITRWAPATENNTGAYVRAVAKALGVDADARIDVHALLPLLARAIAQHENGYIDSAYDWNWVYLK